MNTQTQSAKTHGRIERDASGEWHAYGLLDRKATVKFPGLGIVRCTVKIALGRVELVGWVDAASSEAALKISQLLAARFGEKHLGMFGINGDFSHAPFDTRIAPQYGKVPGFRNVWRTETIEEAHTRVCVALCKREQIPA